MSCLTRGQVVWILRLHVLKRFVGLTNALIELRTRGLHRGRLAENVGIGITTVGCVSLRSD